MTPRWRGPRAKRQSVCAAPGCFKPIYAGAPIIRRPQGSWKHLDCAEARGRNRRARAEDGSQ